MALIATLSFSGCSDPRGDVSIAADSTSKDDSLLVELPRDSETAEKPDDRVPTPVERQSVDIPVPVFLAKISLDQRLLFGAPSESLAALYDKFFNGGGSFQFVEGAVSVRSLAIGEVAGAFKATAETLDLITNVHFQGAEVILPAGANVTSEVAGINFPASFPVKSVTVGLTGTETLPFFLSAYCATGGAKVELCLTAEFNGDHEDPQTRVWSQLPDARIFVKPAGKLLLTFDSKTQTGAVDRHPIAERPLDIALVFRTAETSAGPLTELIVLTQRDSEPNQGAFPTPRHELVNHQAGDRIFEQILRERSGDVGVARLAFVPSGTEPGQAVFKDFGFHEEANAYLTATARNKELIRCSKLGQVLANAATDRGLALEQPLPTNCCRDNSDLTDEMLLSGLLSACSQLGSVNIEVRLNPGGFFWIPLRLNLCFLLRYYHYGSKVPFLYHATDDKSFFNEPWNTAITPPDIPSSGHAHLADALSRMPFLLSADVLEEMRAKLKP